MKYLWLTRFPPYSPLRGGDIEYSRELAHSLANHADVTGLAYATDGVVPPTDSPVAWEILPYRRPSPLLGIFSPLPDVAFRFKTAAYLERAIALACESDAVFVDFIGMAWLVKPLSEALKAKGKSVPIIVVTHNHEGALRLQASRSAGFPRRILLEFDAKKADKLEQEANRIADGITTIIQEDAVSFSQTCDTPMQVMLPGYSGDVRQERTIDDAVPRRATIIGNRNTRYKVAVLDHTLAALSAKGVDREVELEMGGAGNFADTAPRYPAVKFRNFIEDLPAYLNDIRVGLIPDDLGGGFKMRVLTLSALRVPILGLRAAMVGTTFIPGVHYHEVETLEEMADALPALVDDLPKLNAMQEAAYAHCRTCFNWSARGQLLASFAQGLKTKPSPFNG